MEHLAAVLRELKALVPRLQQFEPKDATFVQAEQQALALKKQIESTLQARQAIEQLKQSALLLEMKRLVPDLARHEIAELKLADFVLGVVYLQPYALFEQVFRGYSAEYGKELSLEARKNVDSSDTSHVYGEISFFPFADLIRSIAPNLPESAVFYDLGSGLGKAVIAASLLHPFSKSCGIEILEPLVQFANKRKRVLEKQPKDKVLTSVIQFEHGDLLANSWVDGDVVFCHGTCFTDKDWQRISLAAEKLKQGSYFLSTSQILKSALFEIIETRLFHMSWGTCTLYIHRRRRIGRWAAQMLRGGSASRTDLLPKSVGSKQDEMRP